MPETETFVEADFEEDAEQIVEQIEAALNQGHFEGEADYETYRSNQESPVDVEVNVTGAWANLSGALVQIQDSPSWTVCTFAFSDDGEPRVVLGLTYHRDVTGLLQLQSW